MGLARTVWPCLLFWSCIGQAPPLPPVRWFDPTPAVRPTSPPTLRPLPPLQVQAVPFVRQSFAVRVDARELAIDDQHRWIAPPEQLVARALGGRATGSGRPLRVLVTRFELDTTGTTQAVVALELAGGELGDRTVEVAATAAAGDRAPATLAAAMAAALEQLPALVADALDG